MTAVGMDLGFSAPRLRLTARGRAVFTTLAALPLVIAAAAFALNGGVRLPTKTWRRQAAPTST